MDQLLIISRQFLHRKRKSDPVVTPGQIIFGSLAKTNQREEASSSMQGQPRVIDGFLGLSEDGFIESGGVCSVPGATARWSI